MLKLYFLAQMKCLSSAASHQSPKILTWNSHLEVDGKVFSQPDGRNYVYWFFFLPYNAALATQINLLDSFS